MSKSIFSGYSLSIYILYVYLIFHGKQEISYQDVLVKTSDSFFVHLALILNYLILWEW